MEAKEATDVIATLAGKEVLKQADLTADQINKQVSERSERALYIHY
tara:strand:+ start:226 stop:363 length:138 start_codon:yes stop_codon:yes gene_type:complete